MIRTRHLLLHLTISFYFMTTLIMVALFVLLTQNKGTIATADTQELLEDKVLMLTFLLLSLSVFLSPFLWSWIERSCSGRDGRMTARILLKYLANKLGLEDGSEVLKRHPPHALCAWAYQCLNDCYLLWVFCDHILDIHCMPALAHGRTTNYHTHPPLRLCQSR